MLFGLIAAPLAAQAQQGAVGSNGAPAGLRALSEIKGLHFSVVEKLPHGPGARADGGCEAYVVEPKSSAGKLVSEAGWMVTGEADMKDGRQAVSFAGSMGFLGSGVCEFEQSNVAIFRNEVLLAILYAPKDDADIRPGVVQALEGGAVRVWDGSGPGAPIGDIEVLNGGDLLKFDKLAASESVCGGKASIPNIFNMPITKARNALRASGWQPVPAEMPEGGYPGQQNDLQKQGIVEAEGCAGTGFAPCSFVYQTQGAKLWVTTIGEDEPPLVQSYNADCQP